MDDVIVSIFGSQLRGDFLLVLAVIAMTTIVFLAQIVFRRKSEGGDNDTSSSIETLLAKPEIVDLIREGKTSVKETVESTRDPSMFATSGLIAMITKISDEVEWDIAGIIGVGVTIVLLFMTVSGTVTQVPDEIFSGWLLILGFYFGKGTKS